MLRTINYRAITPARVTSPRSDSKRKRDMPHFVHVRATQPKANTAANAHLLQRGTEPPDRAQITAREPREPLAPLQARAAASRPGLAPLGADGTRSGRARGAPARGSVRPPSRQRGRAEERSGARPPPPPRAPPFPPAPPRALPTAVPLASQSAQYLLSSSRSSLARMAWCCSFCFCAFSRHERVAMAAASGSPRARRRREAGPGTAGVTALPPWRGTGCRQHPLPRPELLADASARAPRLGGRGAATNSAAGPSAATSGREGAVELRRGAGRARGSAHGTRLPSGIHPPRGGRSGAPPGCPEGRAGLAGRGSGALWGSVRSRVAPPGRDSHRTEAVPALSVLVESATQEYFLCQFIPRFFFFFNVTLLERAEAYI